jgi:hypothetical protein
MINTIRNLIRADRIDSWDLHLEAIKKCLPIFAASGHHNYLKSAYLYLQNMLKLPVQNPKVYEMFKNRFNVVRRSDRN